MMRRPSLTIENKILIPFVTIVTARIFLGEAISPLAILGAVLITGGVVMAQRTPAVRKPARQT